MSSLSRAFTRTDDDVFYPDSDGQPMGETDWHILALMMLRQALDDFFTKEDVYVGSDLFFYYLKGDPSACMAPDVMVVKDVGKHLRRTFKTWVEKAIPCTVIELSSQDTWKRDLGERQQKYQQLGVTEYFVFDPEGLYVKPPLRGFRLRAGKYQPLAAAADGSLASKELGLRLRAEGHMLRLIDVHSGQPILTRLERVEQEKQEKEREKRRADELEAEVMRLRSENAKSRGKRK
jgi:hypothetical protein